MPEAPPPCRQSLKRFGGQFPKTASPDQSSPPESQSIRPFKKTTLSPSESPQVKMPVGKNPSGPTDFDLPRSPLVRRNAAAMNKAELVEAVQKALGKEATKRSADEAVEAVLDSISKGVKADKKVQIIGFGTFEVKKRAARMGRNPKTGESMKIAESQSVGFKPSAALKASL